MDIGNCLREARERRGITLRHVADETKITTAVLRDIERNAFDRLPGGVYRKGYLRAFAAEVGVDPDEVAREYDDQCRAPEPPPPPPRGLGGPMWAAVAAVVVVPALIAGGLAVFGSPGGGEAPSARVPAAAFVVPPPPPSPLKAAVPPRAVLADDPAPRGLRLEITPAAACWVSALADGERVIYQLLQPGDRATVIARDELVLRVGQPEAFAYTLNGVPGLALGGRGGEPVTVTITLDNFESFLDDAALDAPVDASVDVS